MKNEKICVVNPRSKRLRLNSFNAMNFNKANRFRFILLHTSHIPIYDGMNSKKWRENSIE